MFLFTSHSESRISFKNLRIKSIKQKTGVLEAVGKAKLAKKIISTAADVYFETIMDEITQELEEAGYKLLDKSFEGILEILTSLETEQKLARKLKEETDAYIREIFIRLSIPLASMVLIVTIGAVFLVRFYQKTVKFMQNAVKRLKEVKYATKIVIRRLDAIELDN